MTTLAINRDRLWESIIQLAKIGAYEDPHSGLTGVDRPTLSPADVLARSVLCCWLEDAGLSVRVDGIGNIFGRRTGVDNQASPVMMGSHIDSVPTGGAFDGPLGVLGALEIVRALNDDGRITHRPLEVACFTEEEGVRFGTDMLGSAVAVGRIPLDDALSLTDRDGVSLGDELQRTGCGGNAPHLLLAPHAYLECHIEQGPILSHQDFDIGIVSGTQGISWQEVTLIGRAAHAGATPSAFRVDAGLAAARLITHLRSMVDSAAFGDLRATVGRLEISPGAVNIIPEVAKLTVDLRHPQDPVMTCAEQEIQRFLSLLEQEHPGLRVTTRRMAKTREVTFDATVRGYIRDAAVDRGRQYVDLLSGAGHDAQELAALCPTGMIFVPGQYDGVSHSPREYSTPEACARGIEVLADTALRLATTPQ
jgi:beta-ureidopropionase / N-carbamoyl-L-amino-acid hydrolase